LFKVYFQFLELFLEISDLVLDSSGVVDCLGESFFARSYFRIDSIDNLLIFSITSIISLFSKSSWDELRPLLNNLDAKFRLHLGTKLIDDFEEKELDASFVIFVTLVGLLSLNKAKIHLNGVLNLAGSQPVSVGAVIDSLLSLHLILLSEIFGIKRILSSNILVSSTSFVALISMVVAVVVSVSVTSVVSVAVVFSLMVVIIIPGASLGGNKLLELLG
jgi:hypothetical protein